MESLKDQVDLQHLPRHIAIIMDGNGRWAKEQGQDRLFGHFHGVESVRNIVEGSAELGIEYLTLYAFSTENWDRPEYEVVGLMVFFQAEDGIRDYKVTGVQTCALPISSRGSGTRVMMVPSRARRLMKPPSPTSIMR